MNIIWLIKKLIALLFALYSSLGVIIIFGDNSKFMEMVVRILFSISLLVFFLTAALIYTY